MPLSTTATTPGTDWATQSSAMGSTDPCRGLQGRKKRECRQGLRASRQAPGATQTTTGGRPGGGTQGGLGRTTTNQPTAGTYGDQYNPGAGNTQPLSQSTLGNQIAQGKVAAPVGSFAAGLGEATGLPMASNDPRALIENYMSSEYGLPYNSTSAQLAGRYLNPGEKVEAILGYIPGNDIDMVNFGAELVGGAGMGTQLDPAQMVSTILQAVQSAGQNGEFGGTSGAANVLNAPNPKAGLDALLGMISGALVGTMPDQALANFLTNLESYAQQFISGQGGFMNQTLPEFAKNEGSGGGWFGSLVSRLGPSLGL